MLSTISRNSKMTQFILKSDPMVAFSEVPGDIVYKSKWGGQQVTFRGDINADAWDIRANGPVALSHANDLIEAFCKALAENTNDRELQIKNISYLDV